jgi:hypothetical protein
MVEGAWLVLRRTDDDRERPARAGRNRMDAGWLRQSLAHSPLSCREQEGASGSSTKLGALDHDSSARSVAAVISCPLAYLAFYDRRCDPA